MANILFLWRQLNDTTQQCDKVIYFLFCFFLLPTPFLYPLPYSNYVSKSGFYAKAHCHFELQNLPLYPPRIRIGFIISGPEVKSQDIGPTKS